jgi:uncharacterized membrane protein HdeD (DUF308 family)
MDTAAVLKKSSGWAIAWSILLIALGIIAIAVPFAAAVAVTALVGWLLIFGGIFHFVMAFSTRGAGAVLWEVLVALVYVIGGGYMLFHPLLGVATLHSAAGSVFPDGGDFRNRCFLPNSRSGWVRLDAV